MRAEPMHAEPVRAERMPAEPVAEVPPPAPERVETRAPAVRPPVPEIPPIPAPPIVSAPPAVPYALPADSGLELVETDRARAPQAPVAEEAETPRPRRVRPPRTEVRDEPLQIVETRKDSPPTAP